MLSYLSVLVRSGFLLLFFHYEKYAGARACVGRKYVFYYFTFFTCFKVSNQSNLILVLTMLVCQYKIVIKDEPQFAGETFEERFYLRVRV